MARTCGWAAKIGPTALSDALDGLAPPSDPNLLVGIESADDAAVYKITPEIAMINTVDFIPPPVDDEEPKYGLCVNGVVHPDRIITNAGSKPGDTLVLTKPLGLGVLLNAVR